MSRRHEMSAAVGFERSPIFFTWDLSNRSDSIPRKKNSGLCANFFKKIGDLSNATEAEISCRLEILQRYTFPKTAMRQAPAYC